MHPLPSSFSEGEASFHRKWECSHRLSPGSKVSSGRLGKMLPCDTTETEQRLLCFRFNFQATRTGLCCSQVFLRLYLDPLHWAVFSANNIAGTILTHSSPHFPL